MNKLFLTEKQVMDYYRDLRISGGDAGMYCQWKDGGIQPLSDAIYDYLNDWWRYIDNGRCRVWQKKPSISEQQKKWKEVRNGEVCKK